MKSSVGLAMGGNMTFALAQGIDGVIFGAGCTGIGGVVGYFIKGHIQKKACKHETKSP